MVRVEEGAFPEESCVVMGEQGPLCPFSHHMRVNRLLCMCLFDAYLLNTNLRQLGSMELEDTVMGVFQSPVQCNGMGAQ